MALIIFINIGAVAHIILERPFDELKENINTILSEIAFAVASLFLPLIMGDIFVSLAGDLIIYVLMGATIMNGIVSAIFIVPALVELYRKYCKKGDNKVNDEIVKDIEQDNGRDSRTQVQKFEMFSMASDPL